MNFIDFDSEYNLNNNNYNAPKTEIYFLNVPFGNDYKHVLSFTSEEKQISTFKNIAKKHITDTNIVKKDTSIKIQGHLGEFEQFNYIMYKNASVSNKWWFAFIESVTYGSDDVTNINISTDVWQSYLFDRKLYRSFVNRSHVPKSEDTPGRWLAPEPFNFSPQETKTIDSVLTSAQWEPQWVLHTTSKYNESTKKYEYKGTGVNGTLSGEYGIYVNTPEEIQSVLKNYGRKSVEEIASDVGQSSGNVTWQQWVNAIFSNQAIKDAVEGIKATTSIADLQDHRNECIGLYAIPKWAKTDGDPNNNIKYISDSLTVDMNKLACGYTPKNKKLLTSICKAFVVYNRNGFQVPLRPELIRLSGGKLNVTIGASPMGTQNYVLYLGSLGGTDSYKDITKVWHKIPYSCQNRIGYDSNTGLDKTINALTGVTGFVSTVGSGVANIAAGDAMGAVSSAGGAAQSSVAMIDALGQKGVSTGASGDITSITDGRATIRFADVSPLKDECEMADNYMEQFGYSIQETLNLNNYINCRSNWNYIQTQNVNLKINGTAGDEAKLRNIFNSGLTIWHNIDTYGDYTKSNN